MRVQNAPVYLTDAGAIIPATDLKNSAPVQLLAPARVSKAWGTLGVNGGYTQQDVIEVARCLTGWTIRGLGR